MQAGGQAKIGEFEMPITVNQDVVGFDVAVVE